MWIVFQHFPYAAAHILSLSCNHSFIKLDCLLLLFSLPALTEIFSGPGFSFIQKVPEYTTRTCQDLSVLRVQPRHTLFPASPDNSPV